MSRVIEMTGLRFGSVVVIEQSGSSKSGDVKWSYLCDCGEEHKATGYSLRSGKVTCCPTCSKDRVALASVTHGDSSSREYGIWTGIKSRCLNPKVKSFKHYGERGISICDRWLNSFDAFLKDMGRSPTDKHSIDRIDNDGNYEPNNCRWATYSEQARNKRNFSKSVGVILVSINGETKSVPDWCKHYKCTLPSAYLRLRQGLKGEAIFKTRRMQLTMNGITDTTGGWAARTGLKVSTISMRVNSYGWSVERALTEGARKCA